MRTIGRHALVLLLVLLWMGAVVYPDPRPFVDSIARLRNPPVDAAAVAEIAAGLPDDHATIEAFSTDYVVYETAWDIYGLPWYFPTVSEVVQDKAGDCQAEAVLTASIFEAKGMPYTLRYSFDHVWVDWPGRGFTAMEDPATAFVSDEGEGWLAGLPDKIPLWTIIKTRISYHWTPMPLAQKLLILVGAAVIIGYGHRRFFARLGRRIARGPEAFTLPPVRRGLKGKAG